LKNNLKFIKFILIILLSFSLTSCKHEEAIDYNKIIYIINDFNLESLEIEDKEELFKVYSKTRSGDDLILTSKNGDILFNDEKDIVKVDYISSVDFEKSLDGKYPTEGYVKFIRDKYIPKSYKNLEINNYALDYKMYSFYPENPAGILNPYNQIRIVFDNKSDKVILFNLIEDFKIKDAPKISGDEAVDIAIKYFKGKISKVDREKIKYTLRVIGPNDYLEGERVNKEKDFRLTYEINFYDDIIFVDAMTGDIVASDSY
jgi:hypothetical protein